MSIQELKEQMQEDLISLLEGMGIEDALAPEDWENLKNEVGEIVISNINRLNQS